jgi:TrpR-related protein YerC/YecD
MKPWNTPRLKSLALAIASLKKEDDLLHFLRDLCTREELAELSERWHIAQLLDQGLSYRQIAKKTKISTTTVTRIAYWLNNGEGGYQAALKKMKKKI